MPDFIIKPRFDRANQTLTFATDKVNAFQSAAYMGTFGFYQQMFGVYGYMKLTKYLKYIVYYPTGSPLLWQAHNSCTWTETNTLGFGSLEIDPIRTKINEALCTVDTTTEVLRAFNDWNGDATTSLSAEGILMTNELTKTMIANATIGAQAQLVAGKVLAAESVSSGTSTALTTAFGYTKNVVTGYVKAAITAGGNLNDTTNLITAGDITSGVYTGDVLDLYDAYVTNANAKLKMAIQIGAQFNAVTGHATYPLWIVSESIFNAVYAKYEELKSSPMQNEVRIKAVTTTYQGAEMTYYKIGNTVVVPEFAATAFTAVTDKKIHFAYLTLSGVIQFGCSFASIPELDSQNVAIRVQQGQRNEDFGRITFLAHALQAAAINDADYITGSAIVE